MPRFANPDNYTVPDVLPQANFNEDLQETPYPSFFTPTIKANLLPSLWGDKVTLPKTTLETVTDPANWTTDPQKFENREDYLAAFAVMGGGTGSGMVAQDPHADAIKRAVLGYYGGPYFQIPEDSASWNMTTLETELEKARVQLKHTQTTAPDTVIMHQGKLTKVSDIQPLPTLEQFNERIEQIGLDSELDAWIESMAANTFESGNPIVAEAIDFMSGTKDTLAATEGTNIPLRIANLRDTVPVVTPEGVVNLARDLANYAGKVEDGFNGAEWFQQLNLKPEAYALLEGKGIDASFFIGSRGSNEAKLRLLNRVHQTTIAEKIEAYATENNMGSIEQLIDALRSNIGPMIAGDPDGALGIAVTLLTIGFGATIKTLQVGGSLLVNTAKLARLQRIAKAALQAKRALRTTQAAGTALISHSTALASVDLVHFTGHISNLNKLALAGLGGGIQNFAADYRDQQYRIAWTMAGLTTDVQHEYSLAQGAAAFGLGSVFGAGIFGAGWGIGAAFRAFRGRMLVAEPVGHQHALLTARMVYEGEVIDLPPRRGLPGPWIEGETVVRGLPPIGLPPIGLEGAAPPPTLPPGTPLLPGSPPPSDGSLPPLLPPGSEEVAKTLHDNTKAELQQGNQPTITDPVAMATLRESGHYTIEDRGSDGIVVTSFNDGATHIDSNAVLKTRISSALDSTGPKTVLLFEGEEAKRVRAVLKGDPNFKVGVRVRRGKRFTTVTTPPPLDPPKVNPIDTANAHTAHVNDKAQVSSHGEDRTVASMADTPRRKLRPGESVEEYLIKLMDEEGELDPMILGEIAASLPLVKAAKSGSSEDILIANIAQLTEWEQLLSGLEKKAPQHSKLINAAKTAVSSEKKFLTQELKALPISPKQAKVSSLTPKQAQAAKKAYDDPSHITTISPSHALIYHKLIGLGIKNDELRLIAASLVNIPLREDMITNIKSLDEKGVLGSVTKAGELSLNVTVIRKHSSLSDSQPFEAGLAETVLHELGHIISQFVSPEEQLELYHLYVDNIELDSILSTYSRTYRISNLDEVFANAFARTTLGRTQEGINSPEVKRSIFILEIAMGILKEIGRIFRPKDISLLQAVDRIATNILNRKQEWVSGRERSYISILISTLTSTNRTDSSDRFATFRTFREATLARLAQLGITEPGLIKKLSNSTISKREVQEILLDFAFSSRGAASVHNLTNLGISPNKISEVRGELSVYGLTNIDTDNIICAGLLLPDDISLLLTALDTKPQSVAELRSTFNTFVVITDQYKAKAYLFALATSERGNALTKAESIVMEASAAGEDPSLALVRYFNQFPLSTQQKLFKTIRDGVYGDVFTTWNIPNIYTDDIVKLMEDIYGLTLTKASSIEITLHTNLNETAKKFLVNLINTPDLAHPFATPQDFQAGINSQEMHLTMGTLLSSKESETLFGEITPELLTAITSKTKLSHEYLRKLTTYRAVALALISEYLAEKVSITRYNALDARAIETNNRTVESRIDSQLSGEITSTLLARLKTPKPGEEVKAIVKYTALERKTKVQQNGELSSDVLVGRITSSEFQHKVLTKFNLFTSQKEVQEFLGNLIELILGNPAKFNESYSKLNTLSFVDQILEQMIRVRHADTFGGVMDPPLPVVPTTKKVSKRAQGPRNLAVAPHQPQVARTSALEELDGQSVVIRKEGEDPATTMITRLGEPSFRKKAFISLKKSQQIVNIENKLGILAVTLLSNPEKINKTYAHIQTRGETDAALLTTLGFTKESRAGQTMTVDVLDATGNPLRNEQNKKITKEVRRVHEGLEVASETSARAEEEVSAIERSDVFQMGIESGLIPLTESMRTDALLYLHAKRTKTPTNFGDGSPRSNEKRANSVRRAIKIATRKLEKSGITTTEDLVEYIAKKQEEATAVPMIHKAALPLPPKTLPKPKDPAEVIAKETKVRRALNTKPKKLETAIPVKPGVQSSQRAVVTEVTTSETVPANTVMVEGTTHAIPNQESLTIAIAKLDATRARLKLSSETLGPHTIQSIIKSTPDEVFTKLGLNKAQLLKLLNNSQTPHSTLAKILESKGIDSYSLDSPNGIVIITTTDKAAKITEEMTTDLAMSQEVRPVGTPPVEKPVEVPVDPIKEPTPMNENGVVEPPETMKDGPSDAPKLTNTEAFIAEEMNNKEGLREIGMDPVFLKLFLRKFARAVGFVTNFMEEMDSVPPEFRSLLTRIKALYGAFDKENRKRLGASYKNAMATFWAAFDRGITKDLAAASTPGAKRKKIQTIIMEAVKEVNDAIAAHNAKHGTNVPHLLPPPDPSAFRFEKAKGSRVPTDFSLDPRSLAAKLVKRYGLRPVTPDDVKAEVGIPKEKTPPKKPVKEDKVPQTPKPAGPTKAPPPNKVGKLVEILTKLHTDDTRLARATNWIGRFFGGSERETASRIEKLINGILNFTDILSHEGHLKRAQVNALRWCAAFCDRGSLMTHHLVASGKHAFKSFEVCHSEVMQQIGGMQKAQYQWDTALKAAFPRGKFGRKKPHKTLKRELETLLIKGTVLNNGRVDEAAMVAAIKAALPNIKEPEIKTIMAAANNLHNTRVSRYAWILRLERLTGWHQMVDEKGDPVNPAAYFAYTLMGKHFVNPRNRFAWIKAATNARTQTIVNSDKLDTFVMWSMGWVHSRGEPFETAKTGLPTDKLVKETGWDDITLSKLRVTGPNSRFPAGTKVDEIPLMTSSSKDYFVRVDEVTGEVQVYRVPRTKQDLSPADLARYLETVNGSTQHFSPNFRDSVAPETGVVEIMMTKVLEFKLHEGTYAYQDTGNTSGHHLVFRAGAREGLVVEPLTWHEVFSDPELQKGMRTDHHTTLGTFLLRRGFELLVQHELDRTFGLRGTRVGEFFNTMQELALGGVSGDPVLEKAIHMGFARLLYDYHHYAGTLQRSPDELLTEIGDILTSGVRIGGATLWGLRSIAEPFVQVALNTYTDGIVEGFKSFGFALDVLFRRSLDADMKREISETVFGIRELLHGFRERYLNDEDPNGGEALQGFLGRLWDANASHSLFGRFMRRTANLASEIGSSRQVGIIGRTLAMQRMCGMLSRYVLNGTVERFAKLMTPEESERLTKLKQAAAVDKAAERALHKRFAELARKAGFNHWGHAAIFSQHGLMETGVLSNLSILFKAVAKGKKKVLSLRQLRAEVEKALQDPNLDPEAKAAMDEAFCIFVAALETMTSTHAAMSEPRGLGRMPKGNAIQNFLKVLIGWSSSFNSNVLRNAHNQPAASFLGVVALIAVLTYISDLLIEWIMGRDTKDILEELKDPATVLPHIVATLPFFGPMLSGPFNALLSSASLATGGTYEGYKQPFNAPAAQSLLNNFNGTRYAVKRLASEDLDTEEKIALIIDQTPILGDTINRSPLTLPHRFMQEMNMIKDATAAERILDHMQRKNSNKYLDKRGQNKRSGRFSGTNIPPMPKGPKSAIPAEKLRAAQEYRRELEASVAHRAARKRKKYLVVTDNQGVSKDLSNLLEASN